MTYILLAITAIILGALIGRRTSTQVAPEAAAPRWSTDYERILSDGRSLLLTDGPGLTLAKCWGRAIGLPQGKGIRPYVVGVKRAGEPWRVSQKFAVAEETSANALAKALDLLATLQVEDTRGAQKVAVLQRLRTESDLLLQAESISTEGREAIRKLESFAARMRADEEPDPVALETARLIAEQADDAAEWSA